ncbi:CrcB family protein [Vibrio splendidus]|uniref:CrcB family protein n=1 Tax=Vibrio splendidus TaxID=29497 RepID=UPI001F5372BE|nr:CrcB family protein [Vibrio splendidus]
MYSLTFLGLVSLGGAIGASCRYIITIQATQVLGQDFPHGTLVVNIIGSCIMGGLVAAVSNSLLVSDAWRPLIAVGFLGALTTFPHFHWITLCS